MKRLILWSLVIGLLGGVMGCVPFTPTPAAVAPQPAVAVATILPATIEITAIPPTETLSPTAENTEIPPTETLPPTVENTAVPPTETPLPPTVENTVVPPTETQVPPTETPVPPTETLVPPTDTPTETAMPTDAPPAPATDLPVPTAVPAQAPAPAAGNVAPLLAAIQRTNAANTLRFRTQAFFSNPFREIELVKTEGERQGGNSRVTLSGLLAELCGCAGLQSIYFGDKYYFQRDGTWFFRTRDEQVNLLDFDPKKTLSPNMTEFSKIGDETVDGVGCEIYTIDKVEGRRIFEQNNIVPAELMSDVVNVEATYWACADGFVHQARLRVDMLRPDGNTNISRTESRYFDFGAPIEIAPPADAQPAP